MPDCFCGCDRSIPAVGHRRRAHKVGSILTDGIPMARGALDRLPEFAEDRELEDLVATGPPLLEQLTAYVHNEVEREDVDTDALNDWNERWQSRYREILKSMNGWAGVNPLKTSRLALTGDWAPATVLEVIDSYQDFNRWIDIELRLRIEPAAAPAFEAKSKVSISRLNVPRPGARFEVAYDPAQPETFTFREADLIT